MEGAFDRTEMLLGAEGLKRLSGASVIVFGVGGVGSYSAEALARSGVGHIALVDADVVSLSNINRQLVAYTDTVGRPKTEVMRERISSINPGARVDCYHMFYSAESAGQIDLNEYDYVMDAIDTVSSKLELIERATRAGRPVISSMGAGNKLDPTRFEVADIYETSVCPLARVMRRELRKRGIDSLKVVYSREVPREIGDMGARVPGSVAFVPPVAGLIMAGEVITYLAGVK